MRVGARKSVGFGLLYAAAVGIWLLLTGIVFAYVIAQSHREAEASFRDDAERTVTQLRDKLKANEAVLAGFSGFLGALDADDRQSARRYAASILDSYPHIYMLEIVRRLEARDREAFEQQMSGELGRPFRVRNFDYAGGRTWQPPPTKAAYFPIIFLWPHSEASASVLGLDVDSVPALRQSMLDAEVRGLPVSTLPFKLVEGDLAYVMFNAVRNSTAQIVGDRRKPFAGQMYALLVVRAAALVPPLHDRKTAYRLRIVRDGAVVSPPLLDLEPADAASNAERMLLPTLYSRSGDLSTSQPIHLSIERQMRFTDINAAMLKLMAILSLLSLSLLGAYLRRHHQDFLHAQELMEQAEYQALHDTLTGLPNRLLLVDRVNHAIASWRRRGNSVALLFLDLDNFKEINDRYGHDVGDSVLTTVAGRLDKLMRESDTVARYGGDEFVVLVARPPGDKDVLAVCDKILAAIAQPIEVDQLTLTLTTSLGISVCPEDGDDFDTLLDRADSMMYRVKRNGRNGAAGSSRSSETAAAEYEAEADVLVQRSA